MMVSFLLPGGDAMFTIVLSGTVIAVMAVVGGMSQRVQASNVQKNAAQYYSNVLIKCNCKMRRRVIRVRYRSCIYLKGALDR